MTQLQRYLAEEVVEDHADGILTRREAIRRLGLLGVTGAAAAALLNAGPVEARSSSRGRSSDAQGTMDEWAPVAGQDIEFEGPRGTLLGAWAPAEQSLGGILVIHENRGLTPHIRRIAGRLAGSGYSALALDLLSEEGGTGSFPDDAAVAAALSRAPRERFVEDMKAAVAELQRRLPRQRIGAIGFCFGGGMVWLLLASGESRLAAAAPFYGPFPEGGSVEGANAAVLGVYGGLDDRVNATRDEAQAALEAANLKHQILTFREAGHAFFNDTGARFEAAAAAEAWRRTLDWFGKYVA